MKKHWRRFVRKVKMDLNGLYFLRLFRLYRRGTITKNTFAMIAGDLTNKCIYMADAFYKLDKEEEDS